MDSQLFALLIIALIAGGLVIALAAFIPLAMQLKKTARQIEITAATMDGILNHEFRELITQGEKVLEELEELPPWVKDQLNHAPGKRSVEALPVIGTPLGRTLLLWAAREGWRLFRR